MTARAPAPPVLVLDPDRARRFLVAQLGLARPFPAKGAAGVRGLLAALRCIQLDPLDRIGTNADLVALARVDGIRKGDVYAHLLPGHAFEHFAKERCLLPAAAFPYYRDQSAQTPWWRHSERMRRLPAATVAAVLAEVAARGPVAAKDLADHGKVEALDWSGWKGTARAATMALEILWLRCQVVVAGRAPGGKLYDLPARALGGAAAAPPSGDFPAWALAERVEAAGLLSMNAGPHWSMLSEARRGGLPERLVQEGRLVRVQLPGAKRTYLATPGFLDRPPPEPDDRMRILGPLDPLLWDRTLVEHAFGFEYVWEVYKPARDRRWGWYVCPLLHRGRLVGRLEAHVEAGRLVVDRLWKEPERGFDPAAYRACLARHAAALGVEPPPARALSSSGRGSSSRSPGKPRPG